MQSKAVPELTIRPMTEQDVDAVVEIEQMCQPQPWTAEHFHNEVAEITFSSPLVAVQGGKTVGFLISWYMADVVEITNVAVHPEFRRQGIGKKLLEAVFEQAMLKSCSGVHLEVRAGNSGAIALYEGAGFVRTGTRQNYYADNNEDAVLMSKILA